MKQLLQAACCTLVAIPAWADMSPVEKQYTKDRKQAIEQFTAQMGEECLKDFSDKKDTSVKPIGAASYNDLISREVYQTVYWTHSNRGVAFTLPVAAKDDQQQTGDIACLYSVRGKRLYFELSQQLF